MTSQSQRLDSVEAIVQSLAEGQATLTAAIAALTAALQPTAAAPSKPKASGFMAGLHEVEATCPACHRTFHGTNAALRAGWPKMAWMAAAKTERPYQADGKTPIYHNCQ